MQPLIIAIVFTKDRNESLTLSYGDTFIKSFFDLISIGINLMLRKIPRNVIEKIKQIKKNFFFKVNISINCFYVSLLL